MEPQSRAPHLFCAGRFIHSHKQTIELVKYSGKRGCYENKELELQTSLPCPEDPGRAGTQDSWPLEETFNPGPETRLDRSELLCNKVLLKYKGERKLLTQASEGGQKNTPVSAFKRSGYF